MADPFHLFIIIKKSGPSFSGRKDDMGPCVSGPSFFLIGSPGKTLTKEQVTSFSLHHVDVIALPEMLDHKSCNTAFLCLYKKSKSSLSFFFYSAGLLGPDGPVPASTYIYIMRHDGPEG